MSAEPIRLVVCDIDGTLLHGSETAIAPAVFAQVRRLDEKGILFCPASGRQHASMQRLFAGVGVKIPYICENGGLVFAPGNSGALLGKTPMRRDLAMRLCGDILAVPDCELVASGAETSYICLKHPEFPDYIRSFVGNNVSMISRPEDIPEDVVKISAYCRQGAAVARTVLAPAWQTHFSVAIAGECWLDFTRSDKGRGLRQLCTALDIPLSAVVAIGDNYNDVPMLSIAAHPYIMDTAAEELRQRFPNHCANAEDVLSRL
ncbi:MAG: Cof-type HAD-IIB family hydrolase [Oscillospiraceae bacterium]|nr:Cof-type HAD-IIB family hydrolase [Oscillospiraceae bacterium]